MADGRKLALLQLVVHILNYLIIAYLFLKSYLDNNINITDITFSVIGFLISLIVFIYIEMRVNQTI